MLKYISQILLLLFAVEGSAQNSKYYVYFTDKAECSLNPSEYFHPNTIERRKKSGIPIVQKSDLPCNKTYVNAVSMAVDSVKMVSRWLNMVVVYADEENLNILRSFPFVKKVISAPERKVRLAHFDSFEVSNKLPGKFTDYEQRLMHWQTERMQGSILKEHKINGAGVRVAVFDAGFKSVANHQAFEHLKIAEAFDFVGNDENPYHGSKHGTAVLSCIGGKCGDQDLGLATGATFLLARTERNNWEFASEEENWLAAAEWADKNGVDVINSSLGYTSHRYFPNELDGEKSLVSKAAQMAFNKGIVVVNSAGNEGDGDWKYIGAPADADSVIAVGGIDPAKDLRINFSSYGPAADGTLKPQITAYGKVLAADSKGGYSITYGTSFSSPLVAGFVACLVQHFDEYNHKDIYEKLCESGHLYPYFDYSHGYGVPLATNVGLMPLAPQVVTQRSYNVKKEGTKLIFELGDYFWKNNLNESSEQLNKKNIFVHVQAPNGLLLSYKVLRSKEKTFELLDTDLYEAGTIVRVHFEGITETFYI